MDGGQGGGTLLQRHLLDLGELIGVVGETTGSRQNGVGSRGARAPAA